MGGVQSKEEQLYQAVLNGNHTAVKSLCRDGTSLEWVDKEGKTPLTLACTRPELFDMVITLLNLGANVNAYRPGSRGGFPLHHAAKRGLDKTVILLLSRGADPLALNDDGQTPLDMARNRGHASVVRIIEDRICLFSGVLREISGPGFLEAIARQWITKKVWAVVLPAVSHHRRHLKLELAIYHSPKVSLWNGGPPSSMFHPAGSCNVSQPRAVIALSKARFEEPNFSIPDPVLLITDKGSRSKFKFLSEHEGDKVQLEKFYKACKGIVQDSGLQAAYSGPVLVPASTVVAPVSRVQDEAITREHNAVAQPKAQKLCRKEEQVGEDVALALAIDASIQSASAEGVLIPSCEIESSLSDEQIDSREGSLRRRSSVDSKRSKHSERTTSIGWGAAEAGPSSVQDLLETALQASSASSMSILSLLSSSRADDHQRTSSINDESENTDLPVDSPTATSFVSDYVSGEKVWSAGKGDSLPLGVKRKGLSIEKGDEKATGQCVVCWDAPARGVCIPCGHMAGCMSCLLEIKEKTWGCPVCRSSIEQVVKVYAV